MCLMSKFKSEQPASLPAKISMISLPNFLAVILILAAILFVSAGRLDWLQSWLFVVAFAGFVVWLTASVHTFLSRTVRIQEERGQRVIDTGPYSQVRHPMYLSVIILMISIPLLLSSLWALIPGMLIGILFILRTALEDRTLQRELPGYSEYVRRVHYRLVPLIW